MNSLAVLPGTLTGVVRGYVSLPFWLLGFQHTQKINEQQKYHAYVRRDFELAEIRIEWEQLEMLKAQFGDFRVW